MEVEVVDWFREDQAVGARGSRWLDGLNAGDLDPGGWLLAIRGHAPETGEFKLAGAEDDEPAVPAPRETGDRSAGPVCQPSRWTRWPISLVEIQHVHETVDGHEPFGA